jgi:hypothetical protein
MKKPKTKPCIAPRRKDAKETTFFSAAPVNLKAFYPMFSGFPHAVRPNPWFWPCLRHSAPARLMILVFEHGFGFARAASLNLFLPFLASLRLGAMHGF